MSQSHTSQRKRATTDQNQGTDTEFARTGGDSRENLDELSQDATNLSRGQIAVRVLAALGLLYTLICAVGLIGTGFGNLGEDTASDCSTLR